MAPDVTIVQFYPKTTNDPTGIKDRVSVSKNQGNLTSRTPKTQEKKYFQEARVHVHDQRAQLSHVMYAMNNLTQPSDKTRRRKKTMKRKQVYLSCHQQAITHELILGDRLLATLFFSVL